MQNQFRKLTRVRINPTYCPGSPQAETGHIGITHREILPQTVFLQACKGRRLARTQKMLPEPERFFLQGILDPRLFLRTPISILTRRITPMQAENRPLRPQKRNQTLYIPAFQVVKRPILRSRPSRFQEINRLNRAGSRPIHRIIGPAKEIERIIGVFLLRTASPAQSRPYTLAFQTFTRKRPQASAIERRIDIVRQPNLAKTRPVFRQAETEPGRPFPDQIPVFVHQSPFYQTVPVKQRLLSRKTPMPVPDRWAANFLITAQQHKGRSRQIRIHRQASIQTLQPCLSVQKRHALDPRQRPCGQRGFRSIILGIKESGRDKDDIIMFPFILIRHITNPKPLPLAIRNPIRVFYPGIRHRPSAQKIQQIRQSTLCQLHSSSIFLGSTIVFFQFDNDTFLGSTTFGLTIFPDNPDNILARMSVPIQIRLKNRRLLLP